MLAPLDIFVSLSLENAQEIFVCRQIVEGEVTRLCAVLASPEDIAELEAMPVAQRKVATDPIGFQIPDSEFHEKRSEIAGNSVMDGWPTAFTIWALSTAHSNGKRGCDPLGCIKDHEAIVKGIDRPS